MRGLKLNRECNRTRRKGRIFYRCVDWNKDFVVVTENYNCVASFTDAWIETNRYEWKRIFTASHLLQMRGLKHYSPTYGMASTSRIFYRCVDWNIARKNRKIFEIVASFTDAWIETLICNHCGLSISSHLLQMRGLKLDKEKGKEDAKRRIFYRCVDWNVDLLSEDEKKIGRIFYRCVDWNLLSPSRTVFEKSHLLQMRGLKPCVWGYI